jgi:hypothetical protein
MVEFEHDRILLAAVDAGVQSEIVEDLLATVFAVDRAFKGGTIQIGWAIPAVVFA